MIIHIKNLTELCLIQFFIYSVLIKQLVVSTLLGDNAVLDNKYAVSLENC